MRVKCDIGLKGIIPLIFGIVFLVLFAVIGMVQERDAERRRIVAAEEAEQKAIAKAEREAWERSPEGIKAAKEREQAKRQQEAVERRRE